MNSDVGAAPPASSRCVCLLIVSGIGIVLSSVSTPLLLLVSGGLLHLLARLGIVPTMLRHAPMAGLGQWT